ncbi:hypothetical protein DIPPA_23721 [Diplonema papillatum]|nr:hypothetical protein DIPPA_23721 [Diplonema papillatum]
MAYREFHNAFDLTALKSSLTPRSAGVGRRVKGEAEKENVTVGRHDFDEFLEKQLVRCPPAGRTPRRPAREAEGAGYAEALDPKSPSASGRRLALKKLSTRKPSSSPACGKRPLGQTYPGPTAAATLRADEDALAATAARPAAKHPLGTCIGSADASPIAELDAELDRRERELSEIRRRRQLLAETHPARAWAVPALLDDSSTFIADPASPPPPPEVARPLETYGSPASAQARYLADLARHGDAESCGDGQGSEAETPGSDGGATDYPPPHYEEVSFARDAPADGCKADRLGAGGHPAGQAGFPFAEPSVPPVVSAQRSGFDFAAGFVDDGSFREREELAGVSPPASLGAFRQGAGAGGRGNPQAGFNFSCTSVPNDCSSHSPSDEFHCNAAEAAAFSATLPSTKPYGFNFGPSAPNDSSFSHSPSNAFHRNATDAGPFAATMPGAMPCGPGTAQTGFNFANDSSSHSPSDDFHRGAPEAGPFSATVPYSGTAQTGFNFANDSSSHSPSDDFHRGAPEAGPFSATVPYSGTAQTGFNFPNDSSAHAPSDDFHRNAADAGQFSAAVPGATPCGPGAAQTGFNFRNGSSSYAASDEFRGSAADAALFPAGLPAAAPCGFDFASTAQPSAGPGAARMDSGGAEPSQWLHTDGSSHAAAEGTHPPCAAAAVAPPVLRPKSAGRRGRPPADGGGLSPPASPPHRNGVGLEEEGGTRTSEPDAAAPATPTRRPSAPPPTSPAAKPVAKYDWEDIPVGGKAGGLSQPPAAAPARAKPKREPLKDRLGKRTTSVRGAPGDETPPAEIREPEPAGGGGCEEGVKKRPFLRRGARNPRTYLVDAAPRAAGKKQGDEEPELPPAEQQQQQQQLPAPQAANPGAAKQPDGRSPDTPGARFARQASSNSSQQHHQHHHHHDATPRAVPPQAPAAVAPAAAAAPAAAKQPDGRNPDTPGARFARQASSNSSQQHHHHHDATPRAVPPPAPATPRSRKPVTSPRGAKPSDSARRLTEKVESLAADWVSYPSGLEFTFPRDLSAQDQHTRIPRLRPTSSLFATFDPNFYHTIKSSFLV